MQDCWQQHCCFSGEKARNSESQKPKNISEKCPKNQRISKNRFNYCFKYLINFPPNLKR